MKPKNFPWRRLARIARVKQRAGVGLNIDESRALTMPTDIKHRLGSVRGLPMRTAETK
jgi:hypothetical protein